MILEGARSGILQLISSPAHRIEIEAIRDSEERSQLLALLDVLAFSPHFNFATCRALAEALMDKGLGVADSAHLAFAIRASAAFVTVDDHLLKHCHKLPPGIWCGGPVEFCIKENLK